MEPRRLRWDHGRLHRTRETGTRDHHTGQRPGGRLSGERYEAGSWVDIHYHRPDQGTTIFRQRILEATLDCIVTFQPETPIERPVVVAGEPILEPGSPTIWFTFPDAWFDMGRFHLRDGRFTGLYANLLTPMEPLGPDAWQTSDLYLDVWAPHGSAPALLDEDELARAVESNRVDRSTAARVRAEAEVLLTGAACGAWPPAIVDAWSLARAERVFR